MDADFSTRYTLRCVVDIYDISQIANKDTILGFKDSYELELRFQSSSGVRRFMFQQHNGSSIINTTSAPLSDNTLYVVGCAWYGPGFYLYVNGALVGEAVVNGIRSLSDSKVNIIGGEGSASNPSRLLDGVIVSDVLIESGRVWSADEFAADSKNLHDNASGTSTFWGAWGDSKQIDVVSHDTLTDNLVSWWDLKEENGTREDSHGDNDLTDHNTVGSATGPRGLAASFNRDNSENLNLDLDGSGLFETGQDISYCQWFRLADTTTENILFFAHQSSNINQIFRVFYRGQQATPDLVVSWKIEQGISNIKENRFFEVNLSADTDYFIATALDVSTGDLRVVLKDTVGNSLIDTTSTGNSGFRYDASADTSKLAIFSGLDHNLNYTGYDSGRSQSIGVWKGKVLSNSEIDYLYNGGSPLFYNNYPSGETGDASNALIGPMMAQAANLR